MARVKNKNRVSSSRQRLQNITNSYSRNYVNEDGQITRKGQNRLENSNRIYSDKVQSKLLEATNRLAEVLRKQGLSDAELQKALKDNSSILRARVEKQVSSELREDRRQEFWDDKNLSFLTRLTGGESGIDGLKNALTNINSSLEKGFSELFKTLNSQISNYASYQTRILARLQGTDKTFNSISDLYAETIGNVPWFKTTDLYDNLATLVGSGVAFNVEQRAFLATISENVASTFSATSETLSRLIRLQQADSTASRLGLEAYLTRFLNAYYENTEYLQHTFDNVSSALLEASSLMSSQQSVGFEYEVQKWLGSLVSLGLSDTTAQNIANAIGYLGSGNISALNSNEALQNLLIMASSYSNTSYADMLTGGLNASTTNELMRGVVRYIQQIANSGNNVVRNQLASIFGLSMSDLTAISNLSQNQLDTIYRNNLDYGSAMGELYNQMGELNSRIPLAQQLENLMSNTTFGIAREIASNPAMYATWAVTDFLENTIGGIGLPTTGIMGTFVDLGSTLSNMLRAGIVGVGTLSSIGSIINGLNAWGNPKQALSNLLSRGTVSPYYNVNGLGLNSLDTGSTVSTYASTNSNDIYQQALDSANQQRNSILGDNIKVDEDDLNNMTTEKEIENIQMNLVTLLNLFVSAFRGDEDKVINVRNVTNNVTDLINNSTSIGG